MTEIELKELLQRLITDWESETVEFKRGKGDFSTDDITNYFSALSNESRLKNQEYGWLVFGVDNKTRSVVGTDYRQNNPKQPLDKLKQQVYEKTSPHITFIAIHEILDFRGDGSNLRVLLFQIPAAPLGMPISNNGHFYARAGESLTALSLDKLDRLRANNQDWSAQIVEEATLADLDEKALKKAREQFIEKNQSRFNTEEMEQWSDSALLDKAKLTRNGKITRAALLLLGKSEASHLLSPHPAQITWKLDAVEQAYEHFYPPFLLATTAIYRKIRNFQIRLLPHDELLAREVSKYDQLIILEALHNCIAHQDYTQNSRILVTEKSDKLIFENTGSFFEGKPLDYLEQSKTPSRYRNKFLADALVNLNMIDTMGYGIYRIHKRQAERYMPLPDYELLPNGVKLTIYGEMVDEAYTKLLIKYSDMPLSDTLALDRVQKKLPIDDVVAKNLRKQKLIEGRRPNYFVSYFVKEAKVKDKVSYIHTRAFDDHYYADLVINYLKKFGSANRNAINALLLSKLSDFLSDEQKERKIGNILTKMRKQNLIINVGTTRMPRWELKI